MTTRPSKRAALFAASLIVAAVGLALTAASVGATEKFHGWETTASCSLRLDYGEGPNGRRAMVLTYTAPPAPNGGPRNVQVYEMNDPNLSRQHRHKLVANATLDDGEALVYEFDPVALYEVHYAGAWYGTATLSNIYGCDDGTTTTSEATTTTTEPTTTTAPTTSTTEGTTTTTEGTTTTVPPSTTEPPTTTTEATTSTTEATTSTTAASSTTAVVVSSTGPTTTGADCAWDENVQRWRRANGEFMPDVECEAGVAGRVVSRDVLARTGGPNPAGLVIAGLGLLGAGGAALGWRRRFA